MDGMLQPQFKVGDKVRISFLQHKDEAIRNEGVVARIITRSDTYIYLTESRDCGNFECLARELTLLANGVQRMIECL